MICAILSRFAFGLSTGEVICKLVCILEYTKNMGAIDHADMQISFSECTIRYGYL